jgi:hypothetical protein
VVLASVRRTWRRQEFRSLSAAHRDLKGDDRDDLVAALGGMRARDLAGQRRYVIMEGVPRGTASRWKTRYAVRLTVPRRGGWRAWGAVRADFERALADPGDPAIAAAEIASELRRGADYVRVSLAFTVVTGDVAGALAIAWDALRSAARDDPAGWEVAAAAAQVQPELPLTGGSDHLAALLAACLGQAVSARGTMSCPVMAVRPLTSPDNLAHS